MEGSATQRADGVSVYYPFALVALQEYRKLDGEDEGEVLLSFLDEDGCRVTVRLKRALAEELRARMAAPPEEPANGNP